MQIFRPFKSHEDSARYLDDKRLNKQVIEAYQVATTCLNLLGYNVGNSNWKHHPIVKSFYNNGTPYLPDLLAYIDEMNDEWIRRGKNRSEQFQVKINSLYRYAATGFRQFSFDNMPEIFVGFGKVTNENIYELYQQYLEYKWKNDKYIVKATLPRKLIFH